MFRNEPKRCWGTVLHDLARHAIACHARLRRPAVAAHLQADQALALTKLLLGKLAPMPLGFPEGTSMTEQATVQVRQNRQTHRLMGHSFWVFLAPNFPFFFLSFLLSNCI